MNELPMPASLPGAETLFAGDQGCELVAYHAPMPVMLQHHHQKPVELQNRLYGKIVYGPTLWLCGSCHDSVHAWLYWMLGERKQPPYIGRAAKAEAERTYQWYCDERKRLGLDA